MRLAAGIWGFTSLFVIGTASLFSCQVSAQASASSAVQVYVIVHGAWGGSWSFKKVDSIMTSHGNLVYRPSLTGQGERVHLASPEVNLTTHINDVVNTILFEDLYDIILVGHSYGGMVITGVADRIPERIRQLIYLDAFVPDNGESLVNIAGVTGESLAKSAKNGFIIPFWVKPDQKIPKDVPQSLKTITEPVVLKNTATSKLPALYILTVDKGKKASQGDFARSAERARKRGWPVIEFTADHNPQWSAPEALVNLLEERRQ